VQVNLTVKRALNRLARSVLLSRDGGKKGMRRLPFCNEAVDVEKRDWRTKEAQRRKWSGSAAAPPFDVLSKRVSRWIS